MVSAPSVRYQRRDHPRRTGSEPHRTTHPRLMRTSTVVDGDHRRDRGRGRGTVVPRTTPTAGRAHLGAAARCDSGSLLALWY